MGKTKKKQYKPPLSRLPESASLQQSGSEVLGDLDAMGSDSSNVNDIESPQDIDDKSWTMSIDLEDACDDDVDDEDKMPDLYNRRIIITSVTERARFRTFSSIQLVMSPDDNDDSENEQDDDNVYVVMPVTSTHDKNKKSLREVRMSVLGRQNFQNLLSQDSV